MNLCWRATKGRKQGPGELAVFFSAVMELCISVTPSRSSFGGLMEYQHKDKILFQISKHHFPVVIKTIRLFFLIVFYVYIKYGSLTNTV